MYASTGSDGTIRVWGSEAGILNNGGPAATAEAATPAEGAAAADDGGEEGKVDGVVRVFGRRDSKVLDPAQMSAAGMKMQFRGHKGGVYALCVEPRHGRWVLSASGDCTLKLWSCGSGSAQAVNSAIDWGSPEWHKNVDQWGAPAAATFEGHEAAVSSCCVSHDGSWAGSGGYDNTVRVWDVETAAELLELDGHANCVNAVAVDRSGRLLFSASSDKTIRAWDARSGRAVRTFGFSEHSDDLGSAAAQRGHSNTITSLAVSVNGAYFVSGSSDHTLESWLVPELYGAGGGVGKCCALM